MFDARTAALLQSAPSFNRLDAQDLPKLLTQQYADLVACRLRGTDPNAVDRKHAWNLGRIADIYEMVTSIEKDPDLRRSAAFVAGTAQQLIVRGNSNSDQDPRSVVSRDGVDGGLTAALLFLIAEQYADASEAAKHIPTQSNIAIFQILAKHVKDLANGRLGRILDRVSKRRGIAESKQTMQSQALQAIGTSLCDGLELLAADILSVQHPSAERLSFSTPAETFRKVLEVCSSHSSSSRGTNRSALQTIYAGPAHLASLLLTVSETLSPAALTKLAQPIDVDGSFWRKWLRFRAAETPYVWPNHREAILKGFYGPGSSAVLVLPTGAGKTTVSALKIAATLARQKKIVFLAPTHALVEQLTDDLQAIFPTEEFGLDVSNDFDAALIPGAQLQTIEVMTPERCLAMLSFSPQIFENIGLLVFDECHLLSPQEGKNRRALESMLCVLTFNAVVPDADMLFLSAMLRNGGEFSEWIAALTKRSCISIDLLWKPSRQVRGVVVYEQDELDNAVFRARTVQLSLDASKGKKSNSVRADAKRQLRVRPYSVWGLQHNWLTRGNDTYFITPILERPVELAGKLGRNSIHVTPNANQVSVQLAAAAAAHGLKTIVFVNTKNDSVSVASDIAALQTGEIKLDDAEAAIWHSIGIELGNVKHSVFDVKKFGAVPHNAAMLRVERILSERLYRRGNGAKVIVATPTLAQGLNLPAQIAILAGDKRMGDKEGERVAMDAHELLNAAARAGRAGHLANGAVLLVPDPVCSYVNGRQLENKLRTKLSSILPEDDRCIDITDPLEAVLDRVMQGEVIDREVRYTVNRLAAFANAGGANRAEDTLINRSLGAYIAKKRGEEKAYADKIEGLWHEVIEVAANQPHKAVLLLASQSGLPLDLLERLRAQLRQDPNSLPASIIEWIDWTVNWIANDANARDELLGEIKEAVLSASGRAAKSDLDRDSIVALRTGIMAWVNGAPIFQIEVALGGNPNATANTHRMCPRARTLISTVIPRGFSFVLSVVARMAEELEILDPNDTSSEKILKALSSAVRRGFDTVHKLEFANRHKKILSRVQIHMMYDDFLGAASVKIEDEH